MKQDNSNIFRNKSVLPKSLKRQLVYEKRNIKALKDADGEKELCQFFKELDRQSLSFIYKICKKTWKGNFCKFRRDDLDLFIRYESDLKGTFAHGHVNRLSKNEIIEHLNKVSKLENGQVFKRLLQCFKP